MKNKAVSGIMLTLLFTSMLTLTFSVQLEDPAPDLSIESIVLPWFPPILYCPPPLRFELGYQINVTVTNEGTADAGSFNVSFSAYWEEEEVPEVWQKETIPSLEQGMTETVSFYFMSENFGYYKLIIIAACDNDVAELDETNNTNTGWVTSTILGDMDGDGNVDSYDFYVFSGFFGMWWPSPPYHPADLDWDGHVDSFDFYLFSGKYGQSVF